MKQTFGRVSDEASRLRNALAAQMSETESLRERVATLNAENMTLHTALTIAQGRATAAERKIANITDTKDTELEKSSELTNAYNSIMSELPTLPVAVALELAKAKIAPKKKKHGASNPRYGEGRTQ